MPRRAVGVILGTLLSLPAFGQVFSQTRKIPPPPGISEATAFRAFFVYVRAREHAADGVKASGKDDRYDRGGIRREAHLTDKEDDLVKQVARHCNEDYEAQTNKDFAELAELRRQYRPKAGEPPPPEVAQRMAFWEERRNDLVAGCLRDLKSGMGDARFLGLYNYVMTTIAPGIHHVDASTLPVTKGPKP